MPTSSRPEQKHTVAEVSKTPLIAADPVQRDGKPRTVWGDAWELIRSRPLFWISASLITLIVFVALFPGVFSSESPTLCFLNRSNNPPEPGHLLGFDRQGCDVFSRVLHGTRASLMVGALATLLAAVVGLLVGSLAGYYGGLLDSILSRLGDIFFAIPTVLGAIVLMTMFSERSPLLVASVIAVFAWPQMARIMRGSVLAARQSDYVMASIALGASRLRILVRHVVPNAIAPLIAVATVALGSYIVAEATLSFLGIGLPPTVMSWGNDISQARASFLTAPLVLVYPASALALTVLSFLMLGDVLRDALDPKERSRR